MTPLTTIRAIPLAVLLLGAAPVVAHAQRLGPPPGADQCDGWKDGLAAGGARARDALAGGWLAGCEDGPRVLAQALRSARLVSDVEHLYALAFAAAGVSDASLFAAALALADDAGATTEARAAAILVTVAQFGASIDFHHGRGSALLTDPAPASGICGPMIYTHGPAERTPLPPDAHRQAAKVLDALIHGADTPALLRNLARCSRGVAGGDVPPQVDLGGVRLEYVCGTTFRIHNPTPIRLVFAYRVEGFSDELDIPVEGSRHEDFDVFETGTVRLLYDGRPLTTLPNGGRPCPESGR
jgi:hypothetical protein